MIPDFLVEEVRARADILEVLGQYLPLKKRGRDYWAPCPFHHEKTPSFHVVPARGFYKCFGCNEAGDVFTFLMKHQGLSFTDAVRQVAAKVGVEIPDDTLQRAVEDPHRALREAVAFAADLYRRQLWEGDAGQRARLYLEGRGIPREAADRFQLGYALDEWRGLREAAHRHGIADDVLVEAGLLKQREEGGEPYDRLRDRLVFPIADAGGRLVGFGGRILDRSREGAPKYLNSPETPLYHKGEHLYGLHWARAAIRREASALVVEGYMDYVSLAVRGIENVVAGLGTAMTAEQAALLARYTRQAVLLYDSDSAGLRATFRTADAMLGAGVHPLVATLPPGEDPDSLVRAGGATALRPVLDAAVDVLDRKLQILSERGYFEGADGIRTALDGLLPTLRATRDPALRDIYVKRVEERTGVRRETLERDLASGMAGGGGGEERRRSVARLEPKRVSKPAGLSGQSMLLLLLLRDESRIERAAAMLVAADFADTASREIFAELVRTGGLRGRSPTVLELGEPARLRLEELLASPEELSDGDVIFDDSVKDILVEGSFSRLDSLDGELAVAHRRGDEDAVRALVQEKMALMQELRSLKGYTVERLFRRYRRESIRQT